MSDHSGLGKIGVAGYRRLAAVNVDFTDRPLAVLIGANGAGKTSFLGAVSLLGAAAAGTLQSYLSEAGGLVEILTRDRATFLALSLETPTATPIRYSLEISPRGAGYVISRESLTEHRDITLTQPFKFIEASGNNIRYYDPENAGLTRPTWTQEPYETSLSQVPKMFARPEQFRRQLASVASFGVLDVSRNSPIRLPQPVVPANLPKPNGEETVSALYQLRESDSERFSILEDSLRTVFPDFRELKFPAAAAGRITLSWKDDRFTRPFYVHELSEGTLRFLWLCAILISPDLPEVVLIDEPDVSMHPVMLQMLVHLMREAARRTQLIVSTQSERFVSFLEPQELLVADLEDGLTHIAWADKKEDLSRWLDDYSLGDLWSMNIFGGRP
jgi:predicted ATPase